MIRSGAAIFLLGMAACDPSPKCSASDPRHWQRVMEREETLIRDRDQLKVITIIDGSVCFWDGSCGGQFATESAAKADGERAAYHGRHAIGS